MKSSDLYHELTSCMRRELTDRILPFWMRHAPDRVRGGFIGRIDSSMRVHPEAPKGGILNARILWTFSSAYRTLGDHAYLEMAERAYTTLRDQFIDPVHGGVFWMLNADGSIADAKKHVYTQAFAIYGLSEYHLASGDAHALTLAQELFHLVEANAYDARHGGYSEGFSRTWVPLEDVRLGDGDAPVKKSFNTHLHLLEAYAALFRAWPDERVRERLTELTDLHLDTILDPVAGHFHPFFDEDWTVSPRPYSYGHDIEAAWLMLDAAEILGDERLIRACEEVLLKVADVTWREGLDRIQGGLNYLGREGCVVDPDKHWWVQAEAIVGFVHAWRIGGEDHLLAAADSIWRFIMDHMKAGDTGEWHFRIDPKGAPYLEEDLLSPWKCPYHNSRAVLQLLAFREVDVSAGLIDQR